MSPDPPFCSASAMIGAEAQTTLRTLAVRLSEQLAQLLRDILGAEYAGTARVVYVVIYVCNAVGKAHNASFKRIRHTVRMTENSVPHLLRQVKRLEQIDHAQALTVMAEAAVIAFLQHSLSRMTERCMTEIVSERDSLGKILIQPQSAGNGTRYLRNLHRVRKTCTVMIGLGRKKDLSLAHQTAKRLRMYYSVAVALKFTAHIAFAYRLLSAAGILGMAGTWRKRSPLVLI